MKGWRIIAQVRRMKKETVHVVFLIHKYTTPFLVEENCNFYFHSTGLENYQAQEVIIFKFDKTFHTKKY